MKYRLKIPKMIRKEDAAQVKYCFPADGCVVEDYGSDEYYKVHLDGDVQEWTIPTFPPDWLEPIQDEPMSAGEWLTKYHPNKDGDVNYSGYDMIQAHKAGEANNELRHKPQKGFDEWWGDIYGEKWYKKIKDVLKFTWEESEINRGHND